jgi:hypothetical protein
MGVDTKMDLTGTELEGVAWIVCDSRWDQCQVIVNKVIKLQVGTFTFLTAVLLKI